MVAKALLLLYFTMAMLLKVIIMVIELDLFYIKLLIVDMALLLKMLSM